MTYEKKQAFEADSEKIEALQQPGQFPELVATDESLVALYNEQLADGQSLTPLQAEDRAMDDETNWTTLRTFFRRAQRLVSERLTVIVSLVSTVLTDVFGHLHERLDGSTEDGIPAIPFGSTASPAVAETLGTLPASVRLLRSRKITNGATDTAIPDGCSLLRCQMDAEIRNAITELIDDNQWGALNSALDSSLYPNLAKLVIGCTSISRSGSSWVLSGFSSLEELEFTYLQSAYIAYSYGVVYNCNALKVVKADALISYNSSDHQTAFVISCAAVTHFYARNFEELQGDYRNALISWCPELTNVYLTAPTLKAASGNNHGSFGECPKLIHLEVGCYRDVDKNLDLRFWSPTMALRTDTDADDYVDLREDTTLSNNLAQFLTNFRSFIALRLTDNGAGKTLTLSQSVRDAIHSAEATYGIEDIIITQKGWAISPAPTV